MLREVREGTGVVARIVARIPVFPGDTTRNVYLFMRPTGEASLPGAETASVRCAMPDEAR